MIRNAAKVTKAAKVAKVTKAAKVAKAAKAFAIFQENTSGTVLTIRLQGAPRNKEHVSKFSDTLYNFFKNDAYWKKRQAKGACRPHLVFDMKSISWLSSMPYLGGITFSIQNSIPWIRSRVLSIAVHLPASRGMSKAITLFAKAFPSHASCPVFIGNSEEAIEKWQVSAAVLKNSHGVDSTTAV